MCLGTLLPLVSMGKTTSVFTNSSTTSNQLKTGSIIVRHIKSISCVVMTLGALLLLVSIVYTQCLSRVYDDKLSREFPILVLVPFIDLTFMTVLDM